MELNYSVNKCMMLFIDYTEKLLSRNFLGKIFGSFWINLPYIGNIFETEFHYREISLNNVTL